MYASSDVILTFPAGAHVTIHDPATDEKLNEVDLRPDERLQYDSVKDIVNAETGTPGSFNATIGERKMHVRYSHNFLIKGNEND